MGAGVSTPNLEVPDDVAFLEKAQEEFGSLTEESQIHLVQQLEPILRGAILESCPTIVTVKVHRAFHMEFADSYGKNDPYVKIDLNGEERKTTVFNNNQNPSWNEEFVFENVVVNNTVLKLSLWDKDAFADDELGNVNIRLAGEGHYDEQRVVSGSRGTLQFSYFVTPHSIPDLQSSTSNLTKLIEMVESICAEIAKRDEAKSADLRAKVLTWFKEAWKSSGSTSTKEYQKQKYAIRKEIREMSKAEQDRFVAALRKMMTNKDGPESSEFFRLAGYHGWPNDYCVHRTECFPVWHRAYLIDFERTLQEADKELGNDGNIGLPYWDFSKVVNGEACPQFMREFDQLPADFFKEDTKHKLIHRGYRVNSDERIKVLLEKSRAAELLALCLEENNHWRHASNETKHGTSIENPHNVAHVALGFPLSSLKFAAFHPLFYLLHCNVDRYYEAYLHQEPDSLQEFHDHQVMRSEEGGKNVFLEPLTPFKNHRKETENEGKLTAPSFCPEDMICNTTLLGFEYDKLPSRRPAQMRTPPIWLLFEDVDIVNNMMDQEGELKSFQLHIFMYDKEHFQEGGKGNSFPSIGSDVETLGNSSDIPGKFLYAGWLAALAGKGPGCSNCRETNLVNLAHDVTKVVKELNIPRSHIGWKIVCVDELGDLVVMEDLQERFGAKVVFPKPTLVGPYFEFNDKSLSKLHDANAKKNGEEDEVKRLQILLAQWGFYKGEVSGEFTSELEDSLKRYQRFVGIVEDGVAGQVTKEMMLTTRNDQDPDEASGMDSPTYPKGSAVKWWLGMSPGYLKHAEVTQEVESALAAWEEKLNGVLRFEKAESQQEANLTIRWADQTTRNPFRFDGKGGCIAHASPGAIQLDSSERWRLFNGDHMDGSSREGEFALLPVLLHELAHAFGVKGHSNNPVAVLGPYYVANRVVLTDADVERVVGLYSG